MSDQTKRPPQLAAGMTKRILKQTIEITDRQEISLPASSVILSVGMQGSRLDPENARLWYICDADDLTARVRVLHIYGTGHPIERHGDHFLGTLFVRGGQLIFHVFIEVGRDFTN